MYLVFVERESHVAVLRGLYRIPGIEPASSACKTNASPAVYLSGLSSVTFTIFLQMVLLIFENYNKSRTFEGWNDSTVDRVLALHMANPGLP